MKRGEETIAAAAMGAGLGSMLGAGAAAFTPTTVTLAEGLKVEARLQTEAGVTAQYGPNSLAMPHAGPDLPAELGVHIDITKLDLPNQAAVLSQVALDKYAALITQPTPAVSEPVQSAMVEHIAQGSLMGAAVCGAAAYGIIKLRQRLQATQADNDLLRADNTALRTEFGLTPAKPETQKQQRRSFMRRGLAALACTGIVAAGCGGMIDRAISLSEEPTQSQPVDPVLVERSALLRDSHVEGAAGFAINALGREVVNYIDKTDQFWDRARKQYIAAFNRFETTAGFKHAQSEGLIPLLHVSDIHCNQAYTARFFDVLVRSFKPAVIVNTGDTQNNAGTMAYESACFDSLGKQLNSLNRDGYNVSMVNVMGNHDGKEPINMSRKTSSGQQPLITTLDTKNQYQATVQGITFVGDSDPTLTTWGPTQPPDQAAQDQLVAKQGQNIAKAACSIHTQNSEKPVVLSHEPEAGYAALAAGCTSIALSGHKHYSSPLVAYRNIYGDSGLVYTAGTASGAGNDKIQTFYAPADQDATATLFLYNPLAQDVASAIQVTVYKTGDVSIKRLPLPSQAEDDIDRPEISSFLDSTTP